MKRFRLREDVNVTEEDGTPIKAFSIDLWVSTEGMEDDTVKNMFEMYANGFTELIEEISLSGDSDTDKVEFTNDIKKGW
jgi:hypothetical protein